MMTPEQTNETFLEVRRLLRVTQQLMYRNGMAGRYHAGKAQNMIDAPEKILVQTTVTDTKTYMAMLPSLAEDIIQRDTELRSLWEEGKRDSENYQTKCTEMYDAYDRLQLTSLTYERLLRQSDKPIIEDARNACRLHKQDTKRKHLERQFRLDINEYIEIENHISATLGRIDDLREEFANSYKEFSDTYVREISDGSKMAMAAGQIGIRHATRFFHDRTDYQFEAYAKHFIKRELDRAGVVQNENEHPY